MDNIVAQFADAQDKLEALKMMLSHIGSGNQSTKELLND
jgi:hypothetical protein